MTPRRQHVKPKRPFISRHPKRRTLTLNGIPIMHTTTRFGGALITSMLLIPVSAEAIDRQLANPLI